MVQQADSVTEDVTTDADASEPAPNPEDRVRSLPERRGYVRWGTLSGVAAAAVAGTWLYRRFGKRSNT